MMPHRVCKACGIVQQKRNHCSVTNFENEVKIRERRLSLLIFFDTIFLYHYKMIDFYNDV